MKIRNIGVFGFFGAIARAIIYDILQNSIESHIIIFMINILGSFLLGFGLEYGKTSKNAFYLQNHKEILSGFIGSFTTFAMLEFNLYQISAGQFPLYPIFWVIIELISGIILYKCGLLLAVQRKVTHVHCKE